MSEHAEFSLLDEYVLGTLTPDDAERVTSHLASCGACRSECAELRSVLDVLPHALTAAEAPAELRDRIFAAIDAPANSATASAPVAALPPQGATFERPARRSPSSGLVGGLAAALVLALAGDAYFALRTARTEVAVAVPARAPAAVPTIRPAPAVKPAARPTAVPPAPPPVAVHTATPTAAPPATDARASAEVARLEHEVRAARAATAADDARVHALTRALAAARIAKPRVVTVLITPPPTAAPTDAPPAGTPPAGTPPAVAPSDSAELVAALRTGRVYTIDGAVDKEPWHLTIVQPRDGAHALLYSGTPGAPSGETYRSWVVRGGQTVSIGELPPGKPATIEMPMALQAGDVIAFSREPVGSGDLPTTKFLMELKITQ